MVAAVRWWIVSACLAGVSAGCATFGGGGTLTGGPPKQSEPAVDGPEDKWNFVGKEGRGSRKLEDEHDPLKPLLMSPEAQAIERNLGFK